MSAKDEQVGGSHYKAMKIQPVEFIEANGIGFCAGNVIKYVCRYQTKNGAEDLRKARHYIDLLLEQIEKPKAGVDPGKVGAVQKGNLVWLTYDEAKAKGLV